MANPTVSYPRFLIRTSQACAIVMIVEFILAMLVIAVHATAIGLRPGKLGLVLACALMSVGYSRRTLKQLQHLEAQRAVPDELMVTLFDTSFGVSTLGLLAVIAATAP